MFPLERDYVNNPFLIQRWVDGKYRTFEVRIGTYDEASGWVEIQDYETKEPYNGYAMNNQIEVRSKIKVIQARTYEEYLYLMREYS